MVLNQFPFSAIWLIGLYVGISRLMSGTSLLVAALATRGCLLQLQYDFDIDTNMTAPQNKRMFWDAVIF